MSDECTGPIELRLATLEANHMALHEDIHRTAPNDPGLSMRVYRIEQLVRTVALLVSAVGTVGILWKAVDAWIGFMVASR